jgi:OOP family OmpA-OmpF porin
MKRQLQYLLLLPFIAFLGACSTTGDRGLSPSCVIGVTGTSAIVGGFTAAATGGGAGLGLVASAFVCQEGGEPEPAPVAKAAPAPIDSDGDGVEDGADRCPSTPSGVSVDQFGCAMDSDNDGVADYLDQCANTPSGVKVDDRGCPVKEEIVFSSNTVNFAFDSSALDRDSQQTLDEIFNAVKAYSGKVKLAVVGHTDSVGSEAYNMKLSQQRAQAVVDYLVSRGIDRGMLTAVGKGEAQPVASNDMDSGRARNRRVELVVQ